MDAAQVMEVFVAVVDAGGFSAASRQLGVPTSTVSRHVARLEDRLGVRLLHRTTRQVAPTEIGWAYYQRCKRIVAEIDEAEALVRSMQATPRGSLRLAAPPTTARLSFIEALVPAFQLAYPEVEVEMVLDARFVDLVGEGYDAGFRAGALGDTSLIARRLVSIVNGAVASPAYLARRGAPADADALLAHDCVTHHMRIGQPRWSRWDGPPAPVSARLVVNDFNVVRGAALAGLGIAFMPLAMIADDLEAGRLVRVLADEIGLDSGISLVYPPGRYLSARVRALVDFSVAWVRTAPLPRYATAVGARRDSSAQRPP